MDTGCDDDASQAAQIFASLQRYLSQKGIIESFRFLSLFYDGEFGWKLTTNFIETYKNVRRLMRNAERTTPQNSVRQKELEQAVLALHLLRDHRSYSLIKTLVEDAEAWSALHTEWATLANGSAKLDSLQQWIPPSRDVTTLYEDLVKHYGLTPGAAKEVCRVVKCSLVSSDAAAADTATVTIRSEPASNYSHQPVCVFFGHADAAPSGSIVLPALDDDKCALCIDKGEAPVTRLIDLEALDLCFPTLLERDNTVKMILDSPAFSSYLNGDGIGLPTNVETRHPFVSLLTTPGAGKSRLLHEFCKHALVREAATRRGVDIVPLHITFNCHSRLAKQPSIHTIDCELVSRILLDASAATELDDRFASFGNMTCQQAVQLWISQRVRHPKRDVLIVMVVDEITHIADALAMTGALTCLAKLAVDRFALGCGHAARIVPVLAGVATVPMETAAMASGCTLLAVPLSLLSPEASCRLVLDALGPDRGIAALRDPGFRRKLLAVCGHPRSLRNLVRKYKTARYTNVVRPWPLAVNLPGVAKIQLLREVTPGEADKLCARGLALYLPPPTPQVAKVAAADNGDSDFKSLRIPAVFLKKHAPPGFSILRKKIKLLTDGPTGELFEAVVAHAFFCRIKCFLEIDIMEVRLRDLLGDRARYGALGIDRLLCNLRGFQHLSAPEEVEMIDPRLVQDGVAGVYYTARQGVTGSVDVAVVFGKGNVLIVQCKLSDAVEGGTLETELIREQIGKSAPFSDALQTALPLVVVSQYPSTEETLKALSGPVAVVDRMALRRFIPSSLVPMVNGLTAVNPNWSSGRVLARLYNDDAAQRILSARQAGLFWWSTNEFLHWAARNSVSPRTAEDVCSSVLELP